MEDNKLTEEQFDTLVEETKDDGYIVSETVEVAKVLAIIIGIMLIIVAITAAF